MTAIDVVVVVGYLLAATGAIVGVWAAVVRPWRYVLPDDPLELEEDTEAMPDDPEDRRK